MKVDGVVVPPVRTILQFEALLVLLLLIGASATRTDASDSRI